MRNEAVQSRGMGPGIHSSRNAKSMNSLCYDKLPSVGGLYGRGCQCSIPCINASFQELRLPFAGANFVRTGAFGTFCSNTYHLPTTSMRNSSRTPSCIKMKIMAIMIRCSQTWGQQMGSTPNRQAEYHTKKTTLLRTGLRPSHTW